MERFGFTPTETKAYIALLKLGPSTGYAVARAVGIARANAYQALDGLTRRGAARRASTIPAQYSAVPPGVLLGDLERSYRRDLASLEETLRAVTPEPSAIGPAPLGVADAEALLDHAAEVCRAAREELLVVMGPWASTLIAPIAIARGNGAAVRVVALGEPAPDGAIVRTAPVADIRAYWGGLPLLVVADRIHAVCGVLAESGVSAGLVAATPGLAPFLRHLVRRELGAAS
jgi:sugar-specific transcriptional regulator TrmB